MTFLSAMTILIAFDSKMKQATLVRTLKPSHQSPGVLLFGHLNKKTLILFAHIFWSYILRNDLISKALQIECTNFSGTTLILVIPKLDVARNNFTQSALSLSDL